MGTAAGGGAVTGSAAGAASAPASPHATGAGVSAAAAAGSTGADSDTGPASALGSPAAISDAAAGVAPAHHSGPEATRASAAARLASHRPVMSPYAVVTTIDDSEPNSSVPTTPTTAPARVSPASSNRLPASDHGPVSSPIPMTSTPSRQRLPRVSFQLRFRPLSGPARSIAIAVGAKAQRKST